MVFLNLLVKPFSIFGIDATIQNRVGAAEYGLYFTLLNVSFLFNIVLDLGINNFTTKNIAQYPHIVSRYMGKLLSFRVLLFLFYTTITLLLGLILDFGIRSFTLLFFLVINQFLVVLIAYFRSHFSGFLFFKTDALISVLDRLLLIVFCGFVLLRTDEFKIEWFIWIQTICYTLTTIIAFLLLLKQIGIPQFSWNWMFSRAIIKKSLPYAVLILLMMIYSRSDVIFLERLHPNGNYEAGVFAQGFRLVDALFLFGMIFSNLLFPMFSKLLVSHQSIIPLLKTSANLLIGGSILVVAFCFFNSEFILTLIYKNNIQESIPSFKWLILSFIGMCFSLIFGTLLTAQGSLKILIISSLFTIVINIGLNFLLIPSLGAEGASIAAFSSQTFVAIIQFVYCAKMFHFRFTFKILMRYSVYILSIVSIFLVFDTKSNNFFVLLIQLILGVLALFITKMVHIKSIKAEFKLEES